MSNQTASDDDKPVYEIDLQIGNQTYTFLSLEKPKHWEYEYWADDDVEPVGYLQPPTKEAKG